MSAAGHAAPPAEAPTAKRREVEPISAAALAAGTDGLVAPAAAWSELSPMEKVSVDMGKAKAEFRNYEKTDSAGSTQGGLLLNVVETHYKEMRKNQTVEFVDRMYAKYHGERGAMLLVLLAAVVLLLLLLVLAPAGVRSCCCCWC